MPDNRNERRSTPLSRFGLIKAEPGRAEVSSAPLSPGLRVGRKDGQPDSAGHVSTSCSKCVEMVGASAGANPHAGLLLSAVFRRLNGKLEWYRCRNCHTRWERLVSKFVFAAQREFWLRTTL